jgi:hypothetical protein
MNYYVTYDELKKQLSERKAHHEQRAEYYTQKAVKLDEQLKIEIAAGDVEEQMRTKVSNSYTNQGSERDAARTAARDHARKSVIFKWKHDHLPAEGSFLISVGEAEEFEFIVSRY